MEYCSAGHSRLPVYAPIPSHIYFPVQNSLLHPLTLSQTPIKLPHLIAYALHRTKLHSSVTFAALILLQRLKAHFPTAWASLGALCGSSNPSPSYGHRYPSPKACFPSHFMYHVSVTSIIVAISSRFETHE
jgi:hypothetical protein